MSGLQQVISFYPDKDQLSRTDFLMELGHYGVTCLWYQYKPFDIKGMLIAYYKDPTGVLQEGEELALLLQDIASWTNSCRKKRIFYYPKASQLVPREFFKKEMNEAAMDLVFGQLTDAILLEDQSEVMSPGISYRVRSEILDQLGQHMSDLIPAHGFRALQQAYMEDDGCIINCNVYPNLLQVTVMNKRQPLLFRQYDYRVPEDAVFHLLSIAEHLDLPKAELLLKLSGMIDEQSNLYLELNKYFDQIQFRCHKLNMGERSEWKDMPKHLFYHVLSLSACVS